MDARGDRGVLDQTRAETTRPRGRSVSRARLRLQHSRQRVVRRVRVARGGRRQQPEAMTRCDAVLDSGRTRGDDREETSVCLHRARALFGGRRVRVPAQAAHGCGRRARQFDARRVRARPARHALCGQRGRRQFFLSERRDAVRVLRRRVSAARRRGARSRAVLADFLEWGPVSACASCRPSASRSSRTRTGPPPSSPRRRWRARRCGVWPRRRRAERRNRGTRGTRKTRFVRALGERRSEPRGPRRREARARGNGGGRGRAGPRRSAGSPGAEARAGAGARAGDGPGRVPGHGRAVPARIVGDGFVSRKKRRRGAAPPTRRLRRRRRLRPRSTRSSWSESGPPSASSPPRRPSRRLSRTTRTRSTRTTTPSSTSRKSSEHNRGSARR